MTATSQFYMCPSLAVLDRADERLADSELFSKSNVCGGSIGQPAQNYANIFLRQSGLRLVPSALDSIWMSLERVPPLARHVLQVVGSSAEDEMAPHRKLSPSDFIRPTNIVSGALAVVACVQDIHAWRRGAAVSDFPGRAMGLDRPVGMARPGKDAVPVRIKRSDPSPTSVLPHHPSSEPVSECASAFRPDNGRAGSRARCTLTNLRYGWPDAELIAASCTLPLDPGGLRADHRTELLESAVVQPRSKLFPAPLAIHGGVTGHVALNGAVPRGVFPLPASPKRAGASLADQCRHTEIIPRRDKVIDRQAPRVTQSIAAARKAG